MKNGKLRHTSHMNSAILTILTIKLLVNDAIGQSKSFMGPIHDHTSRSELNRAAKGETSH